MEMEKIVNLVKRHVRSAVIFLISIVAFAVLKFGQWRHKMKMQKMGAEPATAVSED